MPPNKSVRQTEMKHAIDALEAARQCTVEELRSGQAGSAALEKKKALDAAITLLGAIGDTRLPRRFKVVALGAVCFGPFAEYRLLWDFETDERSAWKEIPLRLSPGDIVIKGEAVRRERRKTQPKERR